MRVWRGTGLMVLALGVGLLTGAAGGAEAASAAARPGCNYAAHPGTAGRQFRHLTAQAQEAARALCQVGILTGTAPDRFAPYLTVTRAQAIAFVVRALGVALKRPAVPTYPDVGPQSPYYADVETASALGLLPFAPPGRKLEPRAPMTRLDFAVLVVLALKQGPAAAVLAASFPPYRDGALIPVADRGYVNEAVRLGIVPPLGPGRYAPFAPLRRVGLALALVRLDAHLRGTMPPPPPSAQGLPATLSVMAARPEVAVGERDALTVAVSSSQGAVLTLSQLRARGYRLSFSATPLGATVQPAAAGGSFRAVTPGSYTVTADLVGPGLSQPVNGQVRVTVYGPAAKIGLSGPPQVVADGQDTVDLTATVEDAEGHPVADFTGAVELSDPASEGAVDLPSPVTAQVVDGVASFRVTASLNPGRTDTLVASVQTATGAPLTPGRFSLTSVVPVATALSVIPASRTLSVSTVTGETVSAVVLDQAGNPMPQGVYSVSFSLSGPATFAQGSLTPEHATYAGGGLGPPQLAQVRIFSVQGQPGTITVTASAPGLTEGSAQIAAVAPGSPAALQAAVLHNGVAGAAAGSPGAAQVQVTVLDGAGVPVPAGQADPLTLTFTPAQDAPVAVGAELAQGMDQVTFDLTDAHPGTFAFTVRDALGLKPATGTVTFTPSPSTDLAVRPGVPVREGFLTVSAGRSPSGGGTAVPFRAQMAEAWMFPLGTAGALPVAAGDQLQLKAAGDTLPGAMAPGASPGVCRWGRRIPFGSTGPPPVLAGRL